MAFNPYYAPYARPMGYYNPSIPQDNQNIQSVQQFQQMPVQQQLPMQTPIQMPMQTLTPNSDMIFVLNEAEATSYPVAPNNSVILWDKNKDVVYIKSVNGQNIPSFRVLDYTERSVDNGVKTPIEHECKCGNKFVSKEDFSALREELSALQNEFEEYKAKSKSKITKKVIEETENDGE